MRLHHWRRGHLSVGVTTSEKGRCEIARSVLRARAGCPRSRCSLSRWPAAAAARTARVATPRPVLLDRLEARAAERAEQPAPVGAARAGAAVAASPVAREEAAAAMDAAPVIPSAARDR